MKRCKKCNFQTNLYYCPNCGDNEKIEDYGYCQCGKKLTLFDSINHTEICDKCFNSQEDES